ncbi:MAG: L-dopachrome tautomerase-related protein [Planctomycetota bacterium]
MPKRSTAAILTTVLLATSGCLRWSSTHVSVEGACVPEIEILAESESRWTGVTAAPDGRVFVNYPRWSNEVPVSVAVLTDDGPVPYPDARWQSWSPGKDPKTHFVCVQSVVATDDGTLWILDPANPGFEGVVDGGPKLVKFDLSTNRRVGTMFFDDQFIEPDSYLNDIRVDPERGWAYITDSGSPGLVVVNLSNGNWGRVLGDHRSTRAEETTVVVEGVDFTFPVHADGLALDPSGDWLFYQALTGRTLYRVPTAALRDAIENRTDPAPLVERVAAVGPSDGLISDRHGAIYLSSLEQNAVRRLTRSGTIKTVVQGPLISWPDTFSIDHEGRLLVTTAQIHLGEEPDEPYRLLRITIP